MSTVVLFGEQNEKCFQELSSIIESMDAWIAVVKKKVAELQQQGIVTDEPKRSLEQAQSAIVELRALLGAANPSRQRINECADRAREESRRMDAWIDRLNEADELRIKGLPLLKLRQVSLENRLRSFASHAGSSIVRASVNGTEIRASSQDIQGYLDVISQVEVRIAQAEEALDMRVQAWVAALSHAREARNLLEQVEERVLGVARVADA